MLTNRIIPVLYLMNGLIVRSESFNHFLVIGNPINQLERLSTWQADELIYIDITREGEHDMRRSDHKVQRRTDILELIQDIAKVSFMPLTFGGRIRTIEDVDMRVANGADKVAINSAVVRDPDLIAQVAKKYGSQCMVVGIDVKKEDGHYHVYAENGRVRTELEPVAWAQKVESLGAGEILLNSIDRDGKAGGFDIEIIRQIADSVNIPVIACGGAGAWPDFLEVLEKTHASAVAAGNIFHFTENAYPRAKKYLKSKNANVR